MTREEILAMQPGRELDVLVAEKVMGGIPWGPFQPSTDISAAWEVVEKLKDTHIYELADLGRNTHKKLPHYAAFNPLNKPRDYNRQIRAKTLPEAICKAALLAVMEVST